jgi:NAD/NADP transhydrogenase alpha subunit
MKFPIGVATYVLVFADIVLKIRQPAVDEVGQFKDGGTLISFLYPGQNKDLVDQLLAKKITAFGKPIHF